MKATVQQSDWKPGRSSDDEKARLLAQMRSALNARSQGGPFSLVTAGSGAYETIWTSDDMANTSALEVDAIVTGLALATGDAARYHIQALFTRTAFGNAVQVGATTVLTSIESIAGFDAKFVASGSGVLVQVRDDGALTMTWSAMVFGRVVS